MSAATDEARQGALHKIIAPTMELRTRRGARVEERGCTRLADNEADSDDARTLRPLQAAACSGLMIMGNHRGNPTPF